MNAESTRTVTFELWYKLTARSKWAKSSLVIPGEINGHRLQYYPFCEEQGWHAIRWWKVQLKKERREGCI